MVSLNLLFLLEPMILLLQPMREVLAQVSLVVDQCKILWQVRVNKEMWQYMVYFYMYYA